MMRDELVERVLHRLSVGNVGSLVRDERSLARLYDAWCARVPFDNLRKRVWLHERRDEMPGDDPTVFFEDFLAHGTGGTCWAGSGALHALLSALGFDVVRAAGSMMFGEDAPTTRRLHHGTVIARIDDTRLLLDTHILTRTPLRLPRIGETTHVEGVGWARAEWSARFECVRIHFDPRNGRPAMSCLLERESVDAAFCRQRHLLSQNAGPFNAQTYVRRHVDDAIVAVALGAKWVAGRPEPIADRTARDALLRSFGYSEEIVARLPDDPSIA